MQQCPNRTRAALRGRRATIAILAALAALAVGAGPAAAAPAFDGHFKVGSQDANNIKIVAGPDGNIWMTLSGIANDVARITPAGNVEEFDLEGVEHPTGIATGPEGDLWLTQEGGVARFSPADPKATTKAFAIAAVKSPASIVAGPDAQMWVATKEGVIHFPPSDPEGKKQEVEIKELTPHDIDVAGSLLVIADAGKPRVVTLTTAGAEQDYPFTNGKVTSSQGVAGSPGSQFAFSESDGPEGLALLTPPNPAKAVQMMGDPFGVALGPDGAYWFAMSAADDLERLTPAGTATPLGGFPPKFFPRQIVSGPGNTLWVAMEIPGGNVVEVARISGLEPPAPPKPPVLATPVALKLSLLKVNARKLKARLTLSEAAALELRIQRILPGRASGNRCVKVTAKNLHGKRCRRFVKVRALERQGAAGANVFGLGKKLAPARYRLLATATAPGGTATATAGFVVKAPKRHKTHRA